MSGHHGEPLETRQRSTPSFQFFQNTFKTCNSHTNQPLLSNFLHFILTLFLLVQGFWFCRQEAGQPGGERLPPVCRVGPRTTRHGHRQLHQQGHAVTAPVEGCNSWTVFIDSQQVVATTNRQEEKEWYTAMSSYRSQRLKKTLSSGKTVELSELPSISPQSLVM